MIRERLHEQELIVGSQAFFFKLCISNRVQIDRSPDIEQPTQVHATPAIKSTMPAVFSDFKNDHVIVDPSEKIAVDWIKGMPRFAL
jgi:hypothetical protein